MAIRPNAQPVILVDQSGAYAVSETQPTANASAPTFSEGSTNALSSDLSGNLRVTLGTLISGEDQANNVVKVEERFGYLNIVLAAPTTTTVKSGAGFLHAIIVNKAAATGVITVYDNTAASGTLIATITQPAAVVESQFSLTYDVAFATGLTIVTATAAQDITVSFR